MTITDETKRGIEAMKGDELRAEWKRVFGTETQSKDLRGMRRAIIRELNQRLTTAAGAAQAEEAVAEEQAKQEPEDEIIHAQEFWEECSKKKGGATGLRELITCPKCLMRLDVEKEKLGALNGAMVAGLSGEPGKKFMRIKRENDDGSVDRVTLDQEGNEINRERIQGPTPPAPAVPQKPTAPLPAPLPAAGKGKKKGKGTPGKVQAEAAQGSAFQHDPRVLRVWAVGQEVEAVFLGERKVKFKVVVDGFSYDGRHFRSLSGLGVYLNNGKKVNGYEAFGLQAKHTSSPTITQEQAAAMVKQVNELLVAWPGIQLQEVDNADELERNAEEIVEAGRKLRTIARFLKSAPATGKEE